MSFDKVVIIPGPNLDWDVEWLFCVLAWRRAARLAEGEAVGAGSGVKGALRGNGRRARLSVPPLELGEVLAIGVAHGRTEVIARHRLTIEG